MAEVEKDLSRTLALVTDVYTWMRDGEDDKRATKALKAEEILSKLPWTHVGPETDKFFGNKQVRHVSALADALPLYVGWSNHLSSAGAPRPSVDRRRAD